jgi:hypothetical protein
MVKAFNAVADFVTSPIDSFIKVNAAENQKRIVCSHIYKFIQKFLDNISTLSEVDKQCVLENLGISELPQTFVVPDENTRGYCNSNALFSH